MIHVGDARNLMYLADGFKSCITDPIWPNHEKVFSKIESARLCRETLELLPPSVERVVLVLGCDSDPRWLNDAVPTRFKFLKNCFLEFCAPSRKGRNLYTHLSAYVFGEWPKSELGARVIPSKVMSTSSDKRLSWHPCPMRVQHCQWLIRWFGKGGVIDPFAGSGSFGVAARRLKIPYIGFEINPTWAELANERIQQEPEPFL